MSNYSALKTDINNNIYENNTQQITGTVLNTVLKDMVNTLGAGYQFAGCAYLDLNPGAPDAKVFYLAGEGLYPNFDNIQVPSGKLGILKWDTRWRLETIEGLGGGGANLTGYISLPSVSDLPEEGQPTIGYLIGENLYLYVGTGGDTADGKYQNCGSFRGPEGVGITDIEQVEQSTENGGRNTIRITLSDGHSYDVYTRNGTTSTGLFPTLAALQSAYPNPVVGQYAFVGAGFPADIYVCNTAGTWTDSGADYSGDNVDLTNYATKAEVSELRQEVTDIEIADISQYALQSDIVGGINTTSLGNNGSSSYRRTDFIPVKEGDEMHIKANCAVTVYVIAFTRDKATIINDEYVNGGGESVFKDFFFAAPADGFVVFSWKTTNAPIATIDRKKVVDIKRSIQDNEDALSNAEIGSFYAGYMVELQSETIGGINSTSLGNNGSSNYRRTDFIPVKKSDIIRASAYCAGTVYMIAFTRNKSTIINDEYVKGGGESTFAEKTFTAPADGFVIFSWKNTGTPVATVDKKKDVDVQTALQNNIDTVYKGIRLWHSKTSYPKIDTSSQTMNLTTNALLLLNGTLYRLGTIWSEDPSAYTAIPYNTTASEYRALVFNSDSQSANYGFRFIAYNATLEKNEYVLGVIRVGSSGITQADFPFRCTVDGMFLEDRFVQNNVLACYPPMKWLPKVRAFTSVSREIINGANTIVDAGLAFVWFTDLHGDSTILKRILAFYDFYKYNNATGAIDDVICTGDFQHNSFDDDFSFWSAAGASGVLNVIGNHDTWYDGMQVKDSISVYNKYFKDFIGEWGVTQPSGAETYGKCYYYKDYTKTSSTPNQKVRLIVLDCMNWDADQYSWFDSVLADAKTNGFSVIIAVHYEPGTVNFDTACFFETPKDLDSHQTSLESVASSKGTGNPLDLVDSFIEGGGEFICWIGGHTHMDRFGFVNGHPGQLSIIGGSAVDVMNGGYPMPVNANDALASTYNQDEFNIISFDTYHKLIRILRVGRNIDVFGRHTNTLAYNYETKEIIYQS